MGIASNGVILDSESEELLLARIFDYFNGQNCPYLVDKPKLFFVDACRGSMRSKAIKGSKNSNDHVTNPMSKISELKDETPITRNPQSKTATKMKQHFTSFKKDTNGQEQQQEIIRKDDVYYHKEANFCCIYANPDGYAAFDGGRKGGYLIRSIERIFLQLSITEKNLDRIILELKNEAKKNGRRCIHAGSSSC